ncbi:hypothetical protein [Cytobacillus depressus]|nr:hypothetical protein [Cytobacillus depressus]
MMKRASREEIQKNPDKFFQEFFKRQEEHLKKAKQPALTLIKGGKE